MIVKTLTEIIEEIDEEYRNENGYYMSVYPNIHFEKVLELMKLVRTQTLIEAANKADVDWNYNSKIYNNDETGYTDIEVYVLKESILHLDKNSIEL